MCGRFTVTAKDSKSIADRFQVELEKALERNRSGDAPPPTAERARKVESTLGRFNVAPTQEVLTVRASPDPEEPPPACARRGRCAGASCRAGPRTSRSATG